MGILADDVLQIGTMGLHEVHEKMLLLADDIPVKELIAKTIMHTADAIEHVYQLQSKGACESNGDPHYSVGLGLHYWGEVCEYEREAKENPRAERILETETTLDTGILA